VRWTEQVAAGVVVLCAVVGLAGGVIGGQTSAPGLEATGVRDPAVQRLMAAVRPEVTFRVGGDPDWMVVTGDAVWVTVDKQNAVVRLNARTNRVEGAVSVAKPCSGLVEGFGSLWVPSCREHALMRVNPKTRKVVAKIPVGPADSEGGIAVGGGSLWMVSNAQSPAGSLLARIDPARNKVAAWIGVPGQSCAVAFTAGSAWVTSAGENLVTRVDATTNQVVGTTRVGKSPRFLTVGAGSVWTLNQGDGTVSRVDEGSGQLVATIDAGLAGHGGEIAYGEGAVWVTLAGFPVTRIDAETNRVTAQWKGKGGDSIRAGLGSVWLTDYDGGMVWRFDPEKLR
jgi:virginiamycin B lyase